MTYLNELEYDIKNGATAEEINKAYPELKNNTKLIGELHYDINNGATIEQINKAYPEVSGEATSGVMPDMATKEQIQKNKPSESKTYNFLAGSATGLIETGGLIGSIPEIRDRINASPLNFLYKLVPDAIKSQIKDFLPEDITRENAFEGTFDVLEKATGLKDTVQEALGADTESGWTTAGEFLTPDTWLGVGALFKGGAKLIPKVIGGTRKEVGDLSEWFVKFTGGISGKTNNEAITLLKNNPEQALKEMNVEQADLGGILEQMKTVLPESAKKEIDQIDILKKQIAETGAEQTKQADLIAEGTITKGATALDEIATLAEKNIIEAKEGTKAIGGQYEHFIGQPSKVAGGTLADDFTKIILDTNKGISKKKKDALVPVMSEINNIVDGVVGKNADGLMKYEDLKQIRQNIDDLIDWKGGDKATNNFLKDVRNTFDDKYIAEQFPISKEVDKAYKEARTFLDDIKETFGKEGVESSAFRNKVKNLWKPENKVTMQQYAKLLGKTDEEMVSISKRVAEDLSTKPEKLGVNLSTIATTKNLETIEKGAISLGIDATKSIKNIETLATKNKYVKSFTSAMKADADKAATTGGVNNNENLIASVFTALDTKAGTEAGNVADNAIAILTKEIGEENMLKISIAKSIKHIVEGGADTTIAGIGFNIGAVFTKIPGVGILLKRFLGKPEKALNYVIKRAIRHNKKDLLEAANNMKGGKNISKANLEKFLMELTGYDFGAKTTGNLLDNE